MGSVKIQMANISDMLSSDLGKGDSLIVNARKNISNIVEGYSQAISVYQSVASTGEKYLGMAKALGDENMISRLTKNIKDANEMIKVSNAAINKVKSI